MCSCGFCNDKLLQLIVCASITRTSSANCSVYFVCMPVLTSSRGIQILANQCTTKKELLGFQSMLQRWHGFCISILALVVISLDCYTVIEKVLLHYTVLPLQVLQPLCVLVGYIVMIFWNCLPYFFNMRCFTVFCSVLFCLSDCICFVLSGSLYCLRHKYYNNRRFSVLQNRTGWFYITLTDGLGFTFISFVWKCKWNIISVAVFIYCSPKQFLWKQVMMSVIVNKKGGCSLNQNSYRLLCFVYDSSMFQYQHIFATVYSESVKLMSSL